MPQQKISHAAIIAESGFLTQKSLIQPSIQIFQYQLFPIAGKRPRQTRNRIKIAFCGFHNPKSDIISNRLHFRQGIGVCVCNIGSAGNAAHLFIFEGLYKVPYGKRIQKAV